MPIAENRRARHDYHIEERFEAGMVLEGWEIKAIRAGQVHINNPPWIADAPFGGYKRSGNGREYGVEGLEEYLETKAILGYRAGPAPAAA